MISASFGKRWNSGKMLAMVKKPDQYSDKEAKVRFEAALRGGLSTPPKPLKSMTPKRAKRQRQKAKKDK
jgi:hypothetical protein